eukprot:TRINITY_DN17829_c0_g1_i3.p1 TRINITY_DN17829_c0_g1~~TRINITY_DN17829_c0_g1_i3.p1  ORF type:complete len:344 (+),score=62.50 TRINITY_DN17829_c0_g1_i3:30-1061(+)
MLIFCLLPPWLLFRFFFFLMIRRPPRSTLSSSSAASDVYKRQVFAHGGNLKPSDLGKDPKLEHQRKALRNNASKVIKKRAELNRITYDNKLLLNRILDVPSVINFKDEHFINTNRRHKQLREETTYYRQKHSPFPIAASPGAGRPLSRARSACGSVSGESRLSSRPGSAPAHLTSLVQPTIPFAMPGELPVFYFERLRAEHLVTVLNMKRPPDMVKRVFSALMILVSPFEPSHFDISWFAVQQWIQELGGVDPFLQNLQAFELSMVPTQNVERTISFMEQTGLQRERLAPLSESLADLCDWMWATCSPGPGSMRSPTLETTAEHSSLSPTAEPTQSPQSSPQP